MVAEFAIYPMGEIHLSQIIAELVKEIKKEGLAFRVGPMGTSIEGEPSQVFEVIQKCFRYVEQNYKRVIMNVTLDSNPTTKNKVMDGMVESVINKVVGHSPHF